MQVTLIPELGHEDIATETLECSLKPKLMLWEDKATMWEAKGQPRPPGDSSS